MKFIPEATLATEAQRLWRDYELQPAFDVEDLADRMGLSILWDAIPESKDERILGQLDPNEALVVLNETHREHLESNGRRVLRFTIGHEIGHWLLHCGLARSGALSLFHEGRIWCRAGDRDPAERQAEMFAARLLMPEALVKRSMPHSSWQGWRVVIELANDFVVSQTAMIIRLEELRLAHRNDTGLPVRGPKPPRGQVQLFE